MLFRTAMLIAAALWANSALAGEQYSSLKPMTTPNTGAAKAFLTTLDPVRGPIGWLQFCRDTPDECQGSDGASQPMQMSTSRMKDLISVNAKVNNEVSPVTDAEHFGVTERWSYPDDGKGDCEDYVLLKRRDLMARGWPASSLLITVVRDLKNEGHAVLTAHTSKGDLILDNVRDEIVSWNQTGYRFVKRQSTENVNLWVSLSDQTSPDLVVAAQR